MPRTVSRICTAGGEVSLKPDFTGHPDGILWKHKGNKVVEFNGREEQFYKPFENRITLDWISADIQITDLRFEDSGEYELELELNKKLQRFFYQLEVIDKIAKPIISCEINDDSIVNISGKLLCSAKPGRLQSVKKFEWRSHGSVQPGPEFNIPLGGEHNEEEYSCTVSNPRSNETATFTAKDCYPVKSPSVGLIAGLVSFFCILLLVALLVLLVLYCKLRHKGNIKGLITYHEQKNSGHIYGSQRGSKKTASPRSPLPAFSQDQNNLGDEDADREHLEEKIQLGKATNSEEAEPNPADVSDVPSEETQSDLELSVPEQTENNTEEHEKTASPPSPRHNESPSLDQSNVGAEDADQHRELAEEETPQVDNSDSEREDPDPAVVKDVPSEETQSDLESSIVPEQPEKNTDQHEKTASPPSPTHRGSASSLDQSHVEDEDADQHRGLAEEKVPQCDPSDSEKADPDPAVVTDVPSEESRSDLESSVTEHTDHNMDNQEDDTPQKGNIKGLIRYHEQKNSGHIYGSQRGSKKTASPRSPLPAFSQDQNNLGDEDADREHLEEKIQLGKATNSEEAEPNPADVSDVPSEETQSDLELSVPEQTENNTEEHEKTASPPSPRHNESPSLDQSNVGAEDADQHRELAEEETPQVDNSDSEREDPDPAVVKDVPSEETQSDLESSIVPEQPEKNTDQHEKTASPPSPTHRGSASSLDQSHVEDEDADQHRGLAEEKVPQCDPSDSEKADPDPAVVTDVPSEESRSDLESSVTEHTGNIKGLIRYHEQKNSGHIYGSQRGSKKTASPRSPLPAFSQDQNNLGDEDADREHLEEKIQLGKATNSEEAEPNPADVSDVPSEETQSDLELSVPEQTENNTEEHEKTASPPSPRHNESPSLDQSNVGAEDADQHRELAEEETPQVHNSDSETEDPDPAGVLDVPSEETQSDLESSIVPEQPGNTTDEHEKTMSPPFPQNNLGAEDADQHRELAEEETPQVDNSDSEREDPDPAVVKDVPSEETQSDLESSIVPEQPEKNTDQHEKTASPPSPTHRGSASSLDQSHVEDEDADQHRGLAEEKVPQCDPSDSKKADPDPAVVTDVPSEESRSDLESSVTEHTEPEKKDDKAEGMQSAPASAEPFSPAQPPEDSTFGHKEDANSQVTKETKEKNVRESDSSGEEERNESDDSTEDQQSPTLPEHKGLETTLHEQDLKAAEEETHTSKDNKQEVSETVKPVSEDGNKTESVGDCKETDKEPDLYLATSQQSQSPTPSNTFQESPDTAGAEPDQEEEEQKGHDKSKVQSDKDKGDAVEDKHEVECGLKEEKPGNESLSEDEEEQKKDKVVA
ncbi:hypothetical protein NQZ68_004299 [Dissostichus eleginoides]|nr:hypothetical protein NQZ68_004299 [Dissostichus eleginoides]